jgi:hypothetical protein
MAPPVASLEKGVMIPITPQLIDAYLKDYKSLDDLLGQDDLLQQLTKALLEQAL